MLSRDEENLGVLRELVHREPHLAEHLEEVTSDLQRWGSAGVHFGARWRETGVSVILKLGVSAPQLSWVRLLAEVAPTLQPKVYAAGSTIGGEDVGWILYERLPMTLNDLWAGREFGLLLDLGVRFHEAATAYSERANVLTAEQLRERLERGAAAGAPGAVAAVLERFGDDWAWMQAVCEPVVCHGDLHLSNALMCVPPPEEAPACAIDPEPVVMPWPLEAAYPQVLNSDPARTGWTDLVQRMGARKRARGRRDLTDSDLTLVQHIALSWLALRQWGVQGPTPDPSWRAPEVWRSWNARYIDEGATAVRSY